MSWHLPRTSPRISPHSRAAHLQHACSAPWSTHTARGPWGRRGNVWWRPSLAIPCARRASRARARTGINNLPRARSWRSYDILRIPRGGLCNLYCPQHRDPYSTAPLFTPPAQAPHAPKPPRPAPPAFSLSLQPQPSARPPRTFLLAHQPMAPVTGGARQRNRMHTCSHLCI